MPEPLVPIKLSGVSKASEQKSRALQGSPRINVGDLKKNVESLGDDEEPKDLENQDQDSPSAEENKEGGELENADESKEADNQ